MKKSIHSMCKQTKANLLYLNTIYFLVLSFTLILTTAEFAVQSSYSQPSRASLASVTDFESMVTNINRTHQSIENGTLAEAFNNLSLIEMQFSAVTENATFFRSEMLTDNQQELEAAVEQLNKTREALENANKVDANYHLNLFQMELVKTSLNIQSP